MKRKFENHAYKKTILYQKQPEKQTLEDNSLIYTYINNAYEIYVITDINENVFTCKRQGKFTFKTNLLPNYNWRSVGVFKKGPIGNESFNVNRHEIAGKAISVLNMLITCPNNVLTEK